MIFTIFYNFLLLLLSLYFIPEMLFKMVFQGKYRTNFIQRWGFELPEVDNSRKIVWIHAVSMGESKAVAPLAKKIKESDPNCSIIISSITETGHAEAKRSMPFADHYVYLPFDFSFIVKHMLNKITPSLVIITETDFWYSFLSTAKAKGAQIVVVNGKLSKSSMQNYKRFPSFSRKLFSNIDLFCLQNEEYEQRFREIGIPSDKMVVTGNLKFDQMDTKLDQEQMDSLKAKFGIIPQQPVLTIASTHNPEEQELLHVLEVVWEKIPDLKVFIAPRHPERFDKVAELFKMRKIPFVRLSSMHDNQVVAENLVLIDKMGLVKTLFQISNLAIVAGSYGSKLGGHNILEPSAYAVPVLFGPFMDSQKELVDLCLTYNAGKQVSLNQLSDEIISLITNLEKNATIGRNALKLIEENKGSLERTWMAIKPFAM